MLELETTSKYRKDLKLMIKRGKDISLLDYIVDKLLKREKLDVKYQDHPLKGNYIGYRECHITPDWLLIYIIDNDRLVLTASRTGTHSDLF
ncbi:MAG: type II toxin-antitoxin system YafQ family toxin [Fibromonadaceae bacterium]|jgi:mRNA interferase YafQ|nr:type II toxin-antitoxin system YafQ family toxin [Fibromonadaceae bacterium]